MKQESTQAIKEIIEYYNRAVILPRLGRGTLGKELIGALELILSQHNEILDLRSTDISHFCREQIICQHGDIGEAPNNYYIRYNPENQSYVCKLYKSNLSGRILEWCLANPETALYVNDVPKSIEKVCYISRENGIKLAAQRLMTLLKFSNTFRLKANSKKGGPPAQKNPTVSYNLMKIN